MSFTPPPEWLWLSVSTAMVGFGVVKTIEVLKRRGSFRRRETRVSTTAGGNGKPPTPVDESVPTLVDESLTALETEMTQLRQDNEEKTAALDQLNATLDNARNEFSGAEARLVEQKDEFARLRDVLLRETDELGKLLQQAKEGLEAEGRARGKEGEQHELLKAQYARTLRVLEVRGREVDEKTRELALLRKEDMDRLSAEDVVRLLRSLNEHVRGLAGFMASQFEFGSSKIANGAEDNADVREAVVRSEEIIGGRMVQLLRRSPPGTGDDEDRTMLELAFRAGMSAYAEWMVSSWCFEDPGNERILNEVYERIRRGESSSTAGRWRSLTRTHAQRPIASSHEDLSIYFLDAFVNVLIVASCTTRSHTALQNHIQFSHSDRLCALVRDAVGLNQSIGEGVVSFDLEVVHVPPDAAYDPAVMERWRPWAEAGHGQEGPLTPTGPGPKGRGKEREKRVLCTVDLGLLRVVKNPASGKLENRVLVKPKVVLEDDLKSL